MSVAAWLLVCASGHGKHGSLEAGLAWGWSLIALVAGTGVILGMTGGFGALGFSAFHAAVLAGLMVARRHRLKSDRAKLSAVGREIRQVFSTDRKSTRLNSSHANISYAVFCLNK